MADSITDDPARHFASFTTRLPRSEWPSTTFRAFFLYDLDRPETLYASVIDADVIGTTYLVDCPSKTCSTDFAKQTVTHLDGPVFAGERTAGGTTTSWFCDLPIPTNPEIAEGGRCAVTSGKDLRPKAPWPTSSIDACYRERAGVIVQVTAGVDKSYEQSPYVDLEMDADEYGSLLKGWASGVCSGQPTPTRKQGSDRTSTERKNSEPTKDSGEGGNEGQSGSDDGSSKEGAATKLSLGKTVVLALGLSTFLMSIM